jgi:hypothetical protein
MGPWLDLYLLQAFKGNNKQPRSNPILIFSVESFSSLQLSEHPATEIVGLVEARGTEQRVR